MGYGMNKEKKIAPRDFGRRRAPSRISSLFPIADTLLGAAYADDLVPLNEDGSQDEEKKLTGQRLIIGGEQNLLAFNEALTGCEVLEHRQPDRHYHLPEGDDHDQAVALGEVPAAHHPVALTGGDGGGDDDGEPGDPGDHPRLVVEEPTHDEHPDRQRVGPRVADRGAELG